MANGTTTIDRTFGTPTNNIKWTWSGWVKPSMTQEQGLFFGYVDASNYSFIGLSSTGQLQLYNHAGGGASGNKKTNRLLRDCSAFYHIVVVWDSAQSTAGDRMKLYVNGVRETSFASDADPTISAASKINGAWSHKVGAKLGSYDFSGVMSHVNFCDGQAYAPSDFGETDATDGMWKIKTSPSVTYGNNGFFLKMEDSSNLDLDSSGNSHTFTTTGTLTATKDNPDNNFCTMNPLDNYWFGGTFSNGNTVTVSPSSPYAMCTSTLGMSSGKYYAEAKLQAGYPQLKFGISCRPAQVSNETMSFSGSTCYSGSDGTLVLDGVTDTGWGSTFSVGDIIGIAVDCDNNRIYFSVNGTWQNSANPSSGSGYETIVAPASTSTGFYHFAWSDNKTNGGSTMQYNFGNGYFGTTAITSAGTNASGNGTFEYDVPTGFTALCTKGINS